MNLFKLFLLFIIYSIIGWIIEVITKLIFEKKYVNRGFLIGPYCPIYGCGAILISCLLKKYLDDPFVLFIMSMVICSILEYLTSFIMEKLFKARWWDYSNKKYNINGRICLETLIPFGIGGLIMMYFVNPVFVKFINMIPKNTLIIICLILFMIFIVDNIISFIIILGFRKITFKVDTDNTVEINNRVKDILLKKSKLSKRLIHSFPNFNIKKRNR